MRHNFINKKSKFNQQNIKNYFVEAIKIIKNYPNFSYVQLLLNVTSTPISVQCTKKYEISNNPWRPFMSLTKAYRKVTHYIDFFQKFSWKLADAYFSINSNRFHFPIRNLSSWQRREWLEFIGRPSISVEGHHRLSNHFRLFPLPGSAAFPMLALVRNAWDSVL